MSHLFSNKRRGIWYTIIFLTTQAYPFVCQTIYRFIFYYSELSLSNKMCIFMWFNIQSYSIICKHFPSLPTPVMLNEVSILCSNRSQCAASSVTSLNVSLLTVVSLLSGVTDYKFLVLLPRSSC